MEDDKVSSDEFRFGQFMSIGATLMYRLNRLLKADNTFLRLQNAHANFLKNENEKSLCSSDACESVFNFHRDIPAESYAEFINTYIRNNVVVTYTIFDTFLTDMTRFLLLMKPAILKDKQIKASEVFSCSTISEVTDSIVNKFVYELAYKSLSERLNYFTQIFGVDFSKEADTISKVEEFARLRNLIVHDAALFQYQTGTQHGEIIIKSKEQNIVVSDEMANDVRDTCEMLAIQISGKICKKIFNRESYLAIPNRHNQP